MMKLAIVILCFLTHVSTLAQKTSLKTTKDSLLQVLYDLRRDLYAGKNKKRETDTLISIINGISNNIRSETDSALFQSKLIFFQSCRFAFSIADLSQKNNVVVATLRALRRKNPDIVRASLSFEAVDYFERYCMIKVNALGVNSLSIKSFRLFVNDYFGAPIHEYIKKGRPEAFSLEISNPYKIKVMLPGLKIFWLKNINTGEILLSDIPFLNLNELDSAVDLKFSKIYGH